MTVHWRLLDTGPAPGPYTAALDEAVARKRAFGEVPDTLHFYRRHPPAVTLGYSLDADREVDIEYCRRNGIDIVRRLSGGGAVYTDDRQLVWSLATRDLLPSSVPRSLELVCTAVAKGLSGLGTPAVFSPANDILVNGRKVSGSAQLRKWGVVLTHGTVLVDAEPDGMFRALRVPAEKLEKHDLPDPRRRVTTLRAELGRLPSIDEVKTAVVSGLAGAFGAAAVPGDLTEGERALARELVRTRYGSEGWNLRREKNA
jgi:lipoate-protein ligase A